MNLDQATQAVKNHFEKQWGLDVQAMMDLLLMEEKHGIHVIHVQTDAMRRIVHALGGRYEDGS